MPGEAVVASSRLHPSVVWLVPMLAAVIGLCTLVMVSTGIMLGRVLDVLAGKRAEIAGGVVMVLVGTAILYEHLSGAA